MIEIGGATHFASTKISLKSVWWKWIQHPSLTTGLPRRMKCHGLCTASEWHVQSFWFCKEYGDHLRQLWFYLFLVGSGCRAQGFCSADLSESTWILPISDHELCWCSHRPVSVQFELGCRSFPSSGHVDMSRLQAGKTEQNSSSEIDHCIQYGCVA